MIDSNAFNVSGARTVLQRVVRSTHPRLREYWRETFGPVKVSGASTSSLGAAKYQALVSSYKKGQ